MKKYLFIAIVFIGLILISPKVFADIGFDAATPAQNVNLTVVNTSITVTSTQSNLILLVGIYAAKSSAINVNSVKYAGSQLTSYVSTTINGTASSTFSLWYLLNPATGTNNVTTTFSTLASVFEICAASYYGVNQSTPFDSTSSVTGTGPSNISSSITTTIANDWTVDSVGDNALAGINLGVGAGQTAACNANTGGEHGGMSYKLIPTPQTTSTYWTNASATWGGTAVSLKAALTPATPANHRRSVIVNGG